MRQVILIGDSIRINYQDEVKQALAGIMDVWSPEENCGDSKFIIENIDRLFVDKTPAVIHLNCGLHDMFLDDGKNCRHSIDDYANNLETIFKKIKTLCPKATVIFALTSPVDEEKQKTSETYGRLVRRNSDVDKYNARAIAIAEKYNVVINDLNTPLKNAIASTVLVDDGIHLNGKGQKVAGRHVAEFLKHLDK